MKKKIILGLALPIFLTSMTLGSIPVQAETAQAVRVQGAAVQRLFGTSRFQTAKAISEQLNNGTANDVILTSGNNFPDALSASVLAKKLNAPILLADSTAQSSTEAMDYIKQHLNKSGTVHIIGGAGVLGRDFIDQLNQAGFSNIERIGGQDRFDTNNLITQKINAPKNTPVVIASGENFPDALSISSIASSKGYPILLVGSEGMPQGVKDFLTSDQPSQVYIIGGIGAVPESIKAQVQSLVPSTSITRLSGADRYETAGQILKTFSLNPENLYLASGNNFPDALAGSALASLTGDPIVLVNSTSSSLPPAIADYFKQLHTANVTPDIVSFGGPAVVSDLAVSDTAKYLQGQTVISSDKPLDKLATQLGMIKQTNGEYIFYGTTKFGESMDAIYVSSPTGDSDKGTMLVKDLENESMQNTAKHLWEFFLPGQSDYLASLILPLAWEDTSNVNKDYTLDGKIVRIKYDRNVGVTFYINM
ncbi:cell wall-binding repeat-containing protein [Desulfitobacterium metallireducens]|uniref:Cell wall-binding protein n=1 Tax=Desulfitobacterium metallireducens DSM 15288 TaxID=871968 RepID=W0EEL6_9FIRM|nr:cell wall-binding repeat-containing protein [Desulfitobacterium metallireducens]AHF07963.1 cell wall-binding protein [Desulfitobacterium metallireducens DSM 15288]